MRTPTRVVAVAAMILTGPTLAGCGRSEAPDGGQGPDMSKLDKGAEVVLTPESVDPDAVRGTVEPTPNARAQVVELRGAGDPQDFSGADAVSPGAPTDAEVRDELRQAQDQLAKFKRFLGSTAYLRTGPRARVLADGTAVAPANAPEAVKKVIQAANAIAKLPYKWGGGHGAWRDNGYDCSGSVSFALAGAGLLDAPRTSGGFMAYGAPGPGEWITIYANGGHMFMVVAGLRFDTSGQGRAGTRWQADTSSTAGLAIRHAPGL